MTLARLARIVGLILAIVAGFTVLAVSIHASASDSPAPVTTAD